MQIDAQRNLLSCFFQDNVLLDLTTVRPEFLVREFWDIMIEMKQMREKNKDVSAIAFSDKYERIRDVASYAMTTREFETCQELIIEEHNRNKIKMICEKVAVLCQDDKKTATELATIISDGLVLESKEEWDNLFPLAFDTFSKIFDKTESIYTMNTTWYGWLDTMLGWWRAGSLYILAARPWIGKSTLMLNMMLKIITSWINCCILSTEMPTKEIHIRAMSNIWGLESWKIENWMKNIEEELAAKIVDFVRDDLGKCSIYDQFYFEDMERIISKEAMRGRKIIFVDYLQQIPSWKQYVNKNSYIEAITNKLKNLAIKYGISIICLSQLKRTNNEPELTDLRDSWAIEQDADVVMFLHNDDEHTNTIDVLVKKNRHRDRGFCRLFYNKKCFSITE